MASSSHSYTLRKVDIAKCCQVHDPVRYELSDLKRKCKIRLFREITEFDDVKDGDYIFPTKGTFKECDAMNLRKIVDEHEKKIKQLEKAIDAYDLPCRFSQCYNHFGQTEVLPRLKARNTRDHPVQRWEYWKNCTQYLSNFNDRGHGQNELQEQIYEIVRTYGIDRNTWDTIFRLNNQRNHKLHVPVTEENAIWLQENADKYEPKFVPAVRTLANALRSPASRPQLARPREFALARYSDNHR